MATGSGDGRTVGEDNSSNEGQHFAVLSWVLCTGCSMLVESVTMYPREFVESVTMYIHRKTMERPTSQDWSGIRRKTMRRPHRCPSPPLRNYLNFIFIFVS